MSPPGPTSVPLHDTIAAAVVRAREALRPHDTAHADKRLTAWLDGFEADMRDILSPHLQAALADPDTPAEVRDLLQTIVAPEHAFQTGLLFAALGALAYPIISAVMTGTVQGIEQTSLRRTQNTPLSPAEVALGMLRHTLGTIDPHDEATKSGIDPARLDVLALNTGDSLPIGEALLLFRRGQITQARLIEALRQSRTRDEWLPEILDLRYAPPPVGEVLAGAVQGHLTIPDATQKIGEAGIDPAEFPWMYETHGRPPGPAQLGELLNRAVITRAQFDQGIRESDVKDKYIDAMAQLAVYVPPVRSIMAMLRAGAIDDAKATALFKENGVRDTDIPGYLDEAHHQKTTQVRDLSQAQVLRLYGAKFMDRAAATARLTTLGYDAPTVTLLLDFADESQHERYVNAVVTRVHSKYVTYKLTDVEARNALTADAIPGAAIDDYMKIWKIERDASIHVLTPASIVGAYRRGQITPLDTKQRLLAVGVQQHDLAIVVADGYPPTKVNEAAVLAVVNA